jgi:hypothetical protein
MTVPLAGANPVGARGAGQAVTTIGTSFVHMTCTVPLTSIETASRMYVDAGVNPVSVKLYGPVWVGPDRGPEIAAGATKILGATGVIRAPANVPVPPVITPYVMVPPTVKTVGVVAL